MVPSFFRNLIRRTLNQRGYQLVKSASLPPDPFAVQRAIITQPRPVIFDLGAHVGDVARIYRRSFPTATLHCFEPFPDSYAKLASSVQADHAIQAHRLAVADRAGSVVMHANQHEQTNSLLATDTQGTAYWREGILDTVGQLQVPTTTLDQFCQEHQVGRVDILKMDVQGSEYAVLQGTRDLLTRQQVALIYMELIMVPTYAGQHKLHEYLALLDGYGYHLLDFYQPARKGSQLTQVDGIFLSPALSEQVRLKNGE